MDKMNECIIGKKTNFRAKQMMIEREPVSIKYFMNGIIKSSHIERNTNCDDQLYLNYEREDVDENDGVNKDQQLEEILEEGSLAEGDNTTKNEKERNQWTKT